MYVPTTLAAPASALAPVGIISTAPPLGRPVRTDDERSQKRAERARRPRCDRHRHAAPRPGGTAGHAAGARAVTDGARSPARAPAPGDASSCAISRIASAVSACACASPATRPTSHAHRRLGWLNVYRLAAASWYGGGGGMACGGSLTSSTMGVANKTLPCGTIVSLRYGDRSVRVPVVDRGPYVAGREFDLTQATKQALGFGDTGEVWSSR